MSTYWRNQFEKNFVSPEEKIDLDEILQEAHDVYWGALGASLIKYHGEIDPTHLATLDQIYQGEIPVQAAARDCYDYAINGRLKLATNGAEQTRMNDSWGRLATLVLSARPDIEVFWPSIRDRQMTLPRGLEKILFHALIRVRLDLDTHPAFQDDEALPMFLSGEDQSGYLTLKEIAVLGQMTERAVRNAAQPTAADQLQTRKEQNQTVVDSNEALRWLKGRRGFIATRAD
ncbi:hypothetical protein NP554_21845 [Pseudomonas asiatica]|uniref:Uncharacterized protein n=1 Tax=Pseudomonas asiatica TaxID=2219225 RepID=A0A9X4D319_9PSED|nr:MULTISPECIES: hypothetical protein [Pseudomonas]MDD2108739.1 hypothetical protein [Pseudomonas asiatica]MDD2114429.1 hypothetical protein [Pseudomonas asiatica]OUS78842.1 hypothetical protein CBP05_28430 [Pseudomonas putida]OUS87484.1 hypothetical protein CBP06_15120 [Pseudomonas putida]